VEGKSLVLPIHLCHSPHYRTILPVLLRFPPAVFSLVLLLLVVEPGPPHQSLEVALHYMFHAPEVSVNFINPEFGKRAKNMLPSEVPFQ